MPRNAVSKTKWARFAALGLPAEARADIEDCIAWYRNEMASARPAGDDRQRKAIDQMRKVTVDLTDRIRDIGVIDLSMILRLAELAAPDGYRPDAGASRARVELMLADLRVLADSLVIARTHLVGKRGPKTRAQEFVRMVAAVIELHTEVWIKQSRKKDTLADMLREILAIADPKIGQGGRGTVDKALRMRARRRRSPIKC
jgi:hypothetical protein